MSESATRRARAARAAPTAAAILLVVAAVVWAHEPLFHDLDRWGGHDWDMVTSFRFLVVQTLTKYRQFPGWNPYACGGYPSWGYVESGTNLVSPFLPFYLLFDLRLALRIEVLGAALIGAAGAFALAGRFTRSPAARALAAVLFVLNSRWAMQAAVGHAMHLHYAWVPWALTFFDRSIDPRRAGIAGRIAPRDSLLAGLCVAMMVYTGAIYPLPQTLVLLGVIAALRCVAERRAAPLVSLAVAGAAALGLSAPKLLPIADTFSRRPRLIESTEAMSPGLLLDVLTSRRPVPVPQWGWHEWGMYIGWAPLVLLVAGALFARGARARVLLAATGLLVVLGLGAFHRLAPWSLLHELPVFRSQHAPSRWLFAALLTLAVAASAGLGRGIALAGRRRTAAEVVGLVVVAAIALDAGAVARGSMQRAFWMDLSPRLTPRTGEFHQEKSVPPHLHYVRRDWAPPSLPGMIASTGILECWSVVPMSIFAKDATGKVPGQGARGRGDPAYRGEAWTGSGEGQVKITSWTPNQVVVEVQSGVAGDWLRLNQNHDPGWRAGGVRAENVEDTPAVRLRGGNERVVFSYTPVHFELGLALAGLTLVAAGAAWLRARRRGGAPPLVAPVE